MYTHIQPLTLYTYMHTYRHAYSICLVCCIYTIFFTLYIYTRIYTHTGDDFAYQSYVNFYQILPFNWSTQLMKHAAYGRY